MFQISSGCEMCANLHSRGLRLGDERAVFEGDTAETGQNRKVIEQSYSFGMINFTFIILVLTGSCEGDGQRF